ncbi:MAG: MFS transporter, partial [Chloroflexi bacterium]|nr:MFS transporter [Chloroflexota bacterium]
AMIMPSTLSIIIDVFPREERAKAIGIWSAAAGLGVPLGMVVGGWLLESFWWGSVFFINIPISAALLLLGQAMIPESRDPRPRRLDVPGAVLSTGALSVLLYSIIEAPESGWTAPLVLAGFGAFLVLAVAFVAYELRSDAPMLDVRLFRSARLSSGAVAISLGFLVMLGMFFLFTQYLQLLRGYTPLETGVRLIPMALGFMIGGGSSGPVVAILGTKRSVTVGLIVVGAALLSLAFLGAATPYWAIAIQLVSMGFGMAWTMAPATDAVMGSVPEENAGVGSALNDVTRNVGGALGVGVLGSIFTSAYGSSVADAVAGLPASAAEAARNSLGAATQVAASIGGDAGDTLLRFAGNAFIDGFGLTMAIAAGIAFVAALVVFRFMPSRALGVPEETGEALASGEPAPVPIPVRWDD